MEVTFNVPIEPLEDEKFVALESYRGINLSKYRYLLSNKGRLYDLAAEEFVEPYEDQTIKIRDIRNHRHVLVLKYLLDATFSEKKKKKSGKPTDEIVKAIREGIENGKSIEELCVELGIRKKSADILLESEYLFRSRCNRLKADYDTSVKMMTILDNVSIKDMSAHGSAMGIIKDACHKNGIRYSNAIYLKCYAYLTGRALTLTIPIKDLIRDEESPTTSQE